MKVCVETGYMATDSGMIPIDSDVVSIAGAGKGCDTAMVVRPSHLSDTFELYVREIICKPTTR